MCHCHNYIPLDAVLCVTVTQSHFELKLTSQQYHTEQSSIMNMHQVWLHLSTVIVICAYIILLIIISLRHYCKEYVAIVIGVVATMQVWTFDC